MAAEADFDRQRLEARCTLQAVELKKVEKRVAVAEAAVADLRRALELSSLRAAASAATVESLESALRASTAQLAEQRTAAAATEAALGALQPAVGEAAQRDSALAAEVQRLEWEKAGVKAATSARAQFLESMLRGKQLLLEQARRGGCPMVADKAELLQTVEEALQHAAAQTAEMQGVRAEKAEVVAKEAAQAPPSAIDASQSTPVSCLTDAAAPDPAVAAAQAAAVSNDSDVSPLASAVSADRSDAVVDSSVPTVEKEPETDGVAIARRPSLDEGLEAAEAGSPSTVAFPAPSQDAEAVEWPAMDEGDSSSEDEGYEVIDHGEASDQESEQR